MRFHLKTQTFCCVFMSRPHENDENDVSFSMKTQTFENALQSGKIWKRNNIGVVWTGRIIENANFWNRSPEWRDLKTQHYRFRVDGSNNWKRIFLETIGHVTSVPVHFHLKISKMADTRKLVSFSCGRVKQFENDRVDAMLPFRFQWNENANFRKRIRVDGA